MMSQTGNTECAKKDSGCSVTLTIVLLTTSLARGAVADGETPWLCYLGPYPLPESSVLRIALAYEFSCAACAT
jgi:hypothetical protein